MSSKTKKTLTVVSCAFAALFAAALATTFVGCGGGDECVHETVDWDEETYVTPTCTEDGSMSGVCADCGEEIKTIIPATGHTWDEGVLTPATCDEDGQILYTCTVCGETSTETVASLGHSYETVYIEAAGGVEAHWALVCSVCGDEQAIEDASDLSFDVEDEDELIAAMALGGEITLADDIALTDTLEIEVDVALDLAGQTVSAGDASENTIEVIDGILTISDSSDGGAIVNTYTGANSKDNAAAVKVDEGATLVLESGTIESSSVGIRAEAVSDDDERTTVEICGGSIESEYYTIWASGDVDITVSGGTIAGASKGLFVAGDDKFGYDGYQSGSTVLTITGGTISCEKDSAICTIGNTSGDRKVINISGGTIIGPDLAEDGVGTPMPAIYNASGNLTITGGTITGSTAVEHRGGNLTITDGNLICDATGAQNAPEYKTSGATSYGYALAIYPYSTGSVTWNLTMQVEITGGTFAGDIYIADNVLNGVDADGDEVAASIAISEIDIAGQIILAEGSILVSD